MGEREGKRCILMKPEEFNEREFFRRIYWHQRWELFEGIFTPGRNDVERLCRNVELPVDLSGKRVLDIGAWHGCFSFECERRGAEDVTALSLENPEETGFTEMKELLESRVNYVRESVYSLNAEDFGKFDVILFFGVLYHLRYPLLALDRIRSVCRDEVYIETHTIDPEFKIRGVFNFLTHTGIIPWILRKTPMWRQYREYELHPEDQSNWFGPNIQAVIESFETAGFECIHLRSRRNRANFKAKVKETMPERLLSHSYESAPANKKIVGLNII